MDCDMFRTGYIGTDTMIWLTTLIVFVYCIVYPICFLRFFYVIGKNRESGK